MLSSLLQFTVLVLIPCSVQGDLPYQWPRQVVSEEGKSIEFHCYQNGTVRDNMVWYQQRPGQALTLVGYFYSGGKPEYGEGFKNGFDISRTNNDRMSKLKVERVLLKDTAIYHCGTGDRARELAFSLISDEAYFGTGTKLVVMEHPVKFPKVTILKPSPAELREKRKATVV
nr:T-cell receptor beta chain [Ginglymostoma cirratum]